MFIGKWVCVIAMIIIIAICGKAVIDNNIKTKNKAVIAAIVCILISIVISL